MLAQRRLFLDVERSVTGRAWRDRLDERTAAGALSIVQRHGVPELLARILAERGEQVAIFGDYDVDGATSTAVLARFLRHGGLDPLIHIPDRIFEGYGPNLEAIRTLSERGATLLVTVDCGTTSIAPIEEARRLGLDVIVI